jgi:predicted secreted Zn-dependent protease
MNPSQKIAQTICTLLFAVFSLNAYADVTDKLVYSYYIATAKPDAPISLALNNASPVRIAGRVFHSHTSWEVNWHYMWIEQADGKCKMNRVYVDLDSKIILPSLVNASDDQYKRFNTYITALRAHELGHVDFGRQAAYAIEKAIVELPELANCKVLDAAANAAANQLLDSYRQKEVKYDVDTNHGRTQGAWID